MTDKTPPAPTPDGDSPLPPDNGYRPSIDPKTGEVHGSGVGAGGGAEGEDFSSDPDTGDGFPDTGAGAGRPDK